MNLGWQLSRRLPIPALAVLVFGLCTNGAADPLPSWNDTAPKKAILAFVEKVACPDSPDFVSPAERIAVFDNDGTLWCEQPMYVQMIFVEDGGAVRLPAEGRHGSRAGRRRARAPRPPDGDARGNDDGGVPRDRRRMDRDGEASEDGTALHRDGVPADARAPRIPARERLHQRRLVLHDRLPTPRRSRTFRFASKSPNASSVPSTQRTRTSVTRVSVPRPRCTRGSFAAQ